jgi:hypothetical protein
MGNEIGPFGRSRILAGGNDSYEISLSQLPQKSTLFCTTVPSVPCIMLGGCGGPQHQALLGADARRSVAYRMPSYRTLPLDGPHAGL